eukprot:754658-Hanusia_phi.AAC.1
MEEPSFQGEGEKRSVGSAGAAKELGADRGCVGNRDVLRGISPHVFVLVQFPVPTHRLVTCLLSCSSSCFALPMSMSMSMSMSSHLLLPPADLHFLRSRLGQSSSSSSCSNALKILCGIRFGIPEDSGSDRVSTS